MMLDPFGEHIYSECDGSGYIISVFPGSQDHLRGIFRGKNLYRSWHIDFDHKKYFFHESRAVKFQLNVFFESM